MLSVQKSNLVPLSALLWRIDDRHTLGNLHVTIAHRKLSTTDLQFSHSLFHVSQHKGMNWLDELVLAIRIHSLTETCDSNVWYFRVSPKDVLWQKTFQATTFLSNATRACTSEFSASWIALGPSLRALDWTCFHGSRLYSRCVTETPGITCIWYKYIDIDHIHMRALLQIKLEVF